MEGGNAESYRRADLDNCEPYLLIEVDRARSWPASLNHGKRPALWCNPPDPGVSFLKMGEPSCVLGEYKVNLRERNSHTGALDRLSDFSELKDTDLTDRARVATQRLD